MSLLDVNVFEVGPRDGLQNESQVLSVDKRVKLIELLMVSGLNDIEVGSFVRSDRIPALANSSQVLSSAQSKRRELNLNTRFWSFVPNQKGFDEAVDVGVDGISLFVATSSTFCQKNVNKTLEDQKKEVSNLLKQALVQNLSTRVYLSTMVYCPYEGFLDASKTAELAQDLYDMGATKIVLSDTTGHATPKTVSAVLEKCVSRFSSKHLSLHFHDTRGVALANVMEGLKFSVTEFDSAIAGLGGCPYAPGASGNLATEDLVYLLSEMRLCKGVNLEKLTKAGFFVEASLGKRGSSKVLRTFQES